MQFEVSAAAGQGEFHPLWPFVSAEEFWHFLSGYFISSRRRLSSDDKREFQSSFDFI